MSANQTEQRKPIAWVLVGSLFLTAFVWACSAATNPDDETVNDVTADAAPPEPAPTPVEAAAGHDAGTHVTPPTPDATGATDANLKVAFIGDTGTGNDFRSVLQLIKREGADLLVVQGDLNYNSGGSQPWFSVVDSELNPSSAGPTPPPTIPYFLAKGNHDVDWNGYGAGLKTRLEQWGIAPENGDPTTRNYSIVYKGLRLVFVTDSETSPVSRADYIQQQLADDSHLWKICSWHKNQRASNIGPKNDEMGWATYEACRNNGAIVAQGHSHTYSRSKTLTADATQVVDATCSDPFALCVGNGKHFFFDSSVGGQDLRTPTTSITSRPYWGSTFTGSFGALFIEFNVGGDPKKAEGYFKTTANVVIDPPASSGKTKFTITRTP